MPSERQAEATKRASRMMSDFRSQWEGGCDVSHLIIPLSEPFRRWKQNFSFPGFGIHHLFGRKGDACHSFTCLVMISNDLHSWCHDSGSPKSQLIVEACGLWSKYERHQRMVRYAPHLIDDDPTRQHWNVTQLNIARSYCTRDKSLIGRVEFLHSELADTPFVDLADNLLEAVSNQRKDDESERVL